MYTRIYVAIAGVRECDTWVIHHPGIEGDRQEYYKQGTGVVDIFAQQNTYNQQNFILECRCFEAMTCRVIKYPCNRKNCHKNSSILGD